MAEFLDRDFKLYVTLFVEEPAFKKGLLAAKKKANVGWDTWELEGPIMEFLVDYPLSEEWRASLEVLGYPDFDLLVDLMPGWQGEGSPYRFQTCEDLLKFPNLGEFSWPEDHRKIALDEIPDHPTIKRFSFPTNFHGGTNQELFDGLVERGFEIVSQVKFGQTVLERGQAE